MTALSIAQLAKRSKREAAARTRAAIKESAIARLAALPASETPIDQRIQRMLQASRPNVMDPAARLLKCPSCGGQNVKSMGSRWYWCMSCGNRWQE